MRVIIISALMILVHVSCDMFTCPTPCTCNGFTVNCISKNLTKIPPGIPTKTRKLYLDQNRLTSPLPGSFSNLPNLQLLSLRANLILSLHNGTFTNLFKLSTLMLSENKISILKKDAFLMLTNLRVLYLNDNHLTEIPDLSNCVKLKRITFDDNRLQDVAFPSSTHQLQQLNVVTFSHNPAVQIIHKSDLAPLATTHLFRLMITYCNIQFIEYGTLAQLPELRKLQLGNNKLDGNSLCSLMNDLGGNKFLHYLELNAVLLRYKLPGDTFNALRGVPLHYLSLSQSKVGTLHNGTFQYLHQLKTLDLSSCHIYFAHPDAFYGLHSLRILLLSKNKFDTFPSRLPPSCAHLDLSYNLLTSLTNNTMSRLVQLRVLDLSHCRIARIMTGVFRPYVPLILLNLSHNALPNNNVGERVFNSLSTLKILDLSYNKLVNFYIEHSILSNLQNLTILNFNNNFCQKLPVDMFSNLNKLKRLDLSHNYLGRQLKQNEISMTDLVNLVSLDLSYNQISNLPPPILQNKAKLRTLNLRGNIISSWKGTLFKSTRSLQKLDVSYNSISVLNQDSLYNLEETMTKLSINLSNNPFACYCSLIWFRNWISTTNISLDNLDSYTCNSPKNMLHHRLLDFHPANIRDLCWPPPWPFIVGSVAASVFLISSLFSILLYWKRWRLRLWWYLRTKSRTKHGHQQYLVDDSEARLSDDQLGGYKYDCFVSMSDYASDEDWVRDLLLPRMDNGAALGNDETGVGDTQGQFSLVCQSVHLPAGEIIHLQAAKAIGDCEKVMIILSKYYLCNGRFAEFELGLAMEKVAQRGWRAVILVVLEPGTDVRLPYGQLHQVLERGEALRWTDDPAGQELFWSELENRLSEPLTVHIN